MTTQESVMNSDHSTWTQVVIEDVDNLSGASAALLFSIVIAKCSAQIVAADGVEGAKVSSFVGTQQSVKVLQADAFLQEVREVVQFDWGDFYLFESEKDARLLTVREDYRTAIPKCVAAVRAVDDTYFYVYTKSDVVADALRTAYAHSQVKQGSLDELDFPR